MSIDTKLPVRKMAEIAKESGISQALHYGVIEIRYRNPRLSILLDAFDSSSGKVHGYWSRHFKYIADSDGVIVHFERGF